MKSSFLLALLLSAACAGPQLSTQAVELARSTSAGGSFHIEFDGSGRMIEAGAEVPLESVPAAAIAAVDAEFPGGIVIEAERVLVRDSQLWMVAKSIGGREVKVLVRDNGTIAGGEEVLPRSDWPQNIVQAAAAAVPDASLERVERVWGDEAVGGESHHVKFRHQGDSIRVGVAQNGSVVRVVRRLEGQIRVPR